MSLDVLKPFEDRVVATNEQGDVIDIFGTGALNSAQVLTARVPVSRVVALVADLPTAYYSLNAPEPIRSLSPDEFRVGNPYVGMEVAGPGGLTVETGARLPLSAEGPNRFGTPAGLTGTTALFETPEAYREGTFSVSLGGRFERQVLPSVRLRLRAVPTLLSVPVRDVSFEGDAPRVQDRRETLVAFQYGAQVVGAVGPTELTGGVIGRTDGASRYGYADPTSLTLGVTVRDLPVRPGLLVRVPLRDYTLTTNAVVGLSLDVPLR